jgi:hypothetical protein
LPAKDIAEIEGEVLEHPEQILRGDVKRIAPESAHP